MNIRHGKRTEGVYGECNRRKKNTFKGVRLHLTT